jgi:chromosome segregation ATPase
MKYNSKIDELIREKIQLESEKKELTDSLSLATNQLKQYENNINKQQSLYEQKIFKINAKKEGLEKKYKNLYKQMKTKEKFFQSENQNLKHKIREIETEKNQIEVQNKYNLNSSMMLNNNTMFNLPAIQSNMLNNSFTVNTNTNNNLAMINNLGSYQTFTFKYDDGDEKKTLEDFKKLLAKIDEKLD